MIRKHTRPKTFFVAALCLVATIAGCSNEQTPPSKSQETIRDASVIVVHKITVPDRLETVGTVRAIQTTQVAAQTMGNILEIHAHEGDLVRSGQLLALIDDSQLRATADQSTASLAAAEKELSAADLDLTLAGTTLTRYQQLYEKKSVSPQEFDEIKAREQSAEARRDVAKANEAQAAAVLARARTSLGYSHVQSPFAGIVTAKLVNVGALASPGMPLFSIEDTHSYRLEVTVDESDAHLVRIGLPVSVTIDALGDAHLSGRVAEIKPAADPSSRSFLVKINLPADQRLRSGIFGRALFVRGERRALLIPRSCILERGQLTAVYVVDENQIAQIRYITVGAVSGENVEVLSGLQDGDKLISTPGERDLSGRRIESHS